MKCTRSNSVKNDGLTATAEGSHNVVDEGDTSDKGWKYEGSTVRPHGEAVREEGMVGEFRGASSLILI